MCVCVSLSWVYPLSVWTEIINWCGLRCVYATHKKVAHMCMKPENLWNERWCETLFALYNQHFFELINTLEIVRGTGVTPCIYSVTLSRSGISSMPNCIKIDMSGCAAHFIKHPFEAEQSVAFDVSGCVMKSLQNNQQHADPARPQPKVMRSVRLSVCPAWLPVSSFVCQGCAEIEISTWMMCVCVWRQSENFQLGRLQVDRRMLATFSEPEGNPWPNAASASCPVSGCVCVSNAVAKFITPPPSSAALARTLCCSGSNGLSLALAPASHAYLMRRRQIWPLHVAGTSISSIFCFWITSSSCRRHMQSLTQLRCRLRLGSQDSCMKSLPYMRVRVCWCVCVRERKRFALKPLCGDAKTSSQVKNYCHSVKWSHLTLGALTRRCYSQKDI